MNRYLFLLLACGVSACSHAQPELLSQLRALDRGCTSDAQCRTVPVGAKPCGGPETYLPYSTAREQPAKVAQIAERYSREREAKFKSMGVAGDCMIVTDPGAVCRAGSCQAADGAKAQ